MLLSLKEIGLSDKETIAYSLGRAVSDFVAQKMQNKHAKFSGTLEAEVSRAIAGQIGEDPTGFYVPDLGVTRDMTATTSSQGGNLIGNAPVGFIPALRNEMHVGRLGATVLDFNDAQAVGNITLPRISTGMSVEHLAENAAANVASNDPAFASINFARHRASASVTYSRRLFNQTGGVIDDILMSDAAEAFAADMDAMALIGTGTNHEPLGVINQPGVGTVTFAAQASWGDVIDFEDTCKIRPGGSFGFLAATAVRKAWRKKTRENGSAEFLWEDGDGDAYGKVAGYRAGASENLTGGKVIFGNWSDLLLAVFGAIDVVPDAITLVHEGKLRMHFTLEYDVALKHPESFVVSTNSGAQ